MQESGQRLLILLEKEEGPGTSSRDSNSPLGHRVTNEMGLTSKDGGANARTGKGHQTGFIS